MLKSNRTIFAGIVVIGALGIAVSACSGAPFTGGIVGAAVSVLGLIAFLTSLALSQLGCKSDDDEKDGPDVCLSMVWDGGLDSDTTMTTSGGTSSNEEATDTEIQMCLSPPYTDAPSDTGLAPCLTIAITDTEPSVCLDLAEIPTDTEIGPCLSPPLKLDTSVEVCLTPIQTAQEAPQISRDEMPDLDPVTHSNNFGQDERQQLIERLSQEGVLPEDVISKLTAKK